MRATSRLNALEMRDACLFLAPELEECLMIDSPSAEITWKGDLSGGKALEVLGLSVLIFTAHRCGVSVQIPKEVKERPDFMYFQNVLPRSHAVKAGHSDLSESYNFVEKYIASLIPKVVLDYKGNYWSVFREGAPPWSIAQFVKGVPSISLRPDLAIVPGRVSALVDGSKITYEWEHKDSKWDFQLRVIDGPVPRVIDFHVTGNPTPKLSGLMECSIEKTNSHLEIQIEGYLNSYGPAHLDKVCYFYLNGDPSRRLSMNLSVEEVIGWTLRPQSTKRLGDLEHWLAGCLGL